MVSLKKGRYGARLAASCEDIVAAQQLRQLCFHGVGDGSGDAEGGCDRTAEGQRDSDNEGRRYPTSEARRDSDSLSKRDSDSFSKRDRDKFDDACVHFLVEDLKTGRLVCCFRILPLAGGAEIGQSYSAQYYELSALQSFTGPMVELGRFCIHPEVKDADVLRIAWGALTQYVDDNAVEMLFGCASFVGTDEHAYLDAFAMLKQRHLAPKRWLPRVKAPQVFRFGQKLRRKPDLKLAMLALPPLLRTYLLMGGWVSDHAVVDRHMNTLHVFTGLEIAAIPPARKRLLRSVAG